MFNKDKIIELILGFFNFIYDLREPILFTLMPLICISILFYLGLTIHMAFILSLIIGMIIWASYYRKQLKEWLKTNHNKILAILAVFSVGVSPIIINELDYEPPGPPFATSWYVSADGDNGGAGTYADPWETLGHVRSQMDGVGDDDISISDNIYLRRGDTFTGHVDFNYGGTSGDWMVLGAYGEEGVSGHEDSDSRPIISADGDSYDRPITWDHCGSATGYYRIEYIDMTDMSTGSNVAVITNMDPDVGQPYLDNITISHVDIYGNSNSHDKSVFFYVGENITIENVDSTGGVISFNPPSYSGTVCKDTKIVNCTVDGNGDSAGIVYHRGGGNANWDLSVSKRHHIKNCTVYDTHSGDKNYVLGVGSDYLVENCVAYGTGEAGFSTGHDVWNVTFQNCTGYLQTTTYPFLIATGNNIIIRNCTGYDSESHVMFLAVDCDDDNNWGYDEDGELHGCAIYHNNFVVTSSSPFSSGQTIEIQEGGHCIDYSDGYEIYNCVIKNNIFAAFESLQSNMLYRSIPLQMPPNGVGQEVTFHYNQWWYYTGGSSTARFRTNTPDIDFDDWHDLYYGDDEWGNPDFEDEANRDFDLTVDSPCIDAAGALTQTDGTGSSATLITVDNAVYFSDGWGITAGDTIRVGDDNNLVITEVDYDNDQITVSTPFDWGDGEDIYLSGFWDYSGSGPDIGAYEYEYQDVSNTNPTLDTPDPTDEEENVERSPTLSIDLDDAEFPTQNVDLIWSWYDTDHWETIDTDYDITTAGTKTKSFADADEYFTEYTWRVYAEDSEGGSVTKEYDFTTTKQVFPASALEVVGATTTTLSLEWNKGAIDGSHIFDKLYVDGFTKYNGGDTPVLGQPYEDYEVGGIRETILLVNETGYAVKESGNYVMYYTAKDTRPAPSNPNIYTTCRAISADGISWTRSPAEPVFWHNCSTGVGTLENYTMPGSVIKRGAGDYILYYSHPYYGATADTKIYYTTSTDGINWVKKSVANEDDYLLEGSDFTDCDYLAIPAVKKIDGTWYLVGEGWEDDHFEVFMAESSNPLSGWTASNSGNSIITPSAWDIQSQANPSLYKIGTNQFIILYNGQLSTTVRYQLGVQYSTSITSGWTNWVNNPILTHGDVGEFDYRRMEGPNVFMDHIGNDTLPLWYFGLPTTSAFTDGEIGYATCADTITKTMVRYSTADDLVDRTDGDQAYYDQDSHYKITSLSPATKYYIKAWSYHDTYGWSESGSSTLEATTLFSETIRYGGEDYFTWLGEDGTASDVADIIANFDAGSEYIAIWDETLSEWDDTDGLWTKYLGTDTGDGFDIDTFDVVKVVLEGADTQVIYMQADETVDYDGTEVRTLSNLVKNKGYNYTGYFATDVSTLSGAVAKTNMVAGEAMMWWDGDAYEWKLWLVGFSTPINDKNVNRNDVFLTKVSTTRTFTVG